MSLIDEIRQKIEPSNSSSPNMLLTKALFVESVCKKREKSLAMPK